jgi:DNA polymerase III delta subunit
VKFYEFVDQAPDVGRLVVIEGTERVLADRALDLIVNRLLPPALAELNLQRFGADDVGDFSRVREAAAAMPFLAERRLTVVSEAQALKAQARRDLLAVAQDVPEGNTLAIVDLTAPRSQRPQSLGALAGRSALRIDTTASEEVRARFVTDTLKELEAKAEPRVVDALVRSDADLVAVRNDLEKLALGGKRITVADLEREALSIEDPKTYKYASALVGGATGRALRIADECFAGNPRGAAMQLLSAIAGECGYLWELTRRGGELPARLQFRERTLRPIARRVGPKRARLAHERAVGAIEAIVTGQAVSDPDDQRTLVERISVEVSELLR